MGSKATHHLRGAALHPLKEKAHPGFKGAQAQVAERLESQGVDPAQAENRAGAILAAGARNASAAAKKANPNLDRVKY